MRVKNWKQGFIKAERQKGRRAKRPKARSTGKRDRRRYGRTNINTQTKDL